MKNYTSRMQFNSRVIFLFIALILTLSGTLVGAVPQLTITQPPAFRQFWSYMYGTATGIAFDDYWIAPLLYVPGLGWYSKPYDGDYGTYARVIPVYEGWKQVGDWETEMQTGGIDDLATIVVAYLIPKTSYPACYPFVSGAQNIPASLEAAAVASDRAMTTGQRKISWSGMDWFVKTSLRNADSYDRVGPGRNYFYDSNDNVWVDTSGKLHLKIVNINNKWTCAEISSALRMGYGTYRFYIDSRLDNLDKYATLGLFTWSDFASVAGNREIDLEFTTWGDNSILPNNAQYVVQPYGVSGNMFRYTMDSTAPSIQSFLWEPSRIAFSSRNELGPLISNWDYTKLSGIPVTKDERVHLNLWLNNSSGTVPGPSSGQPVEIVISKFEFIPWQDPARPVVAISGQAASDSLARTASDNFRFKLFGKVASKDCNGFILNDGSATPLNVLDSGHTFSVGDKLTVEGTLSPTTPKLLDTSSGRITPVN